MLNVRNLSRLSSLVRLNSPVLGCSPARGSSAQAGQEPKGDHHKDDEDSDQNTYGQIQPTSSNRPPAYDPAIIDPFMKSFEYYNLSKEEKEQLEDFLAQPKHKKAWTYAKIMTKEATKFLINELFDWQTMKDEQYLTNDRDLLVKWQFTDKTDIKRWLISCDSTMNNGYSTASLTVNKQGRLVFSGYLDCEHLPNDGVTEFTGYAHLSSPYAKTGFGLEGFYNWSHFNHLVLRFRGDGRVYRILIKGPNLQGMQEGNFYEYFLYTRGGPYWQVAKIPFSKFLACFQGRIQEKAWELPTSKVQCFALTINKYTGPFRLEISHIGLELDYRNYQGFDYEGYFRPNLD